MTILRAGVRWVEQSTEKHVLRSYTQVGSQQRSVFVFGGSCVIINEKRHHLGHSWKGDRCDSIDFFQRTQELWPSEREIYEQHFPNSKMGHTRSQCICHIFR